MTTKYNRKNQKTGAISPARARYSIRLVISATALLSAFALLGYASLQNVQALLIEPEDHWKYEMKWLWDPELKKTIGRIEPQIVIANETADRIVGYIADANGTRLEFYNDEQVVQARFAYEEGFFTEWEMVGRTDRGYFTIEVPSNYADADRVQISIGNNQYTVNNGTPTTPQAWVFVNSARLDHPRSNSTDLQVASSATLPPSPTADQTGGNSTETVLTTAAADSATANAAETVDDMPAECRYSGTSLIDYILMKIAMPSICNGDGYDRSGSDSSSNSSKA